MLAPTAPATGPDITVSNGRERASVNVTQPPEEVVIRHSPSKPSSPQAGLEPLEVGGHGGAHVRVDHGRRGSLVLPVLAGDLVRERERALEAGLAQELRGLDLVRGVARAR